MGIVSDFIISTDEVPFYDGIADFPNEDRASCNRITPLEAAGILLAIRGKGDRLEMISEFILLTEEDADHWLQTVPDDFMGYFGKCSDVELRELAIKTSDITRDELGWPVDDFIEVFNGIRRISIKCLKDGKKMFLWNSL